MAPEGDEPKWVPIAQRGKPPYRYDSELEARKTLNICYPDLCREQRLGDKNRVRIKEVEV